MCSTYCVLVHMLGSRANNGVRFVLLSHARAGSTALTSALGQHPEIAMFGEVFSDEPEERKRAMARSYLRPTAPNRASCSYDISEDGAAFLSERLYGPSFALGRRAVGFKLFYEQARNDYEAEKAWTYVMAETDIRIIHLRRADLLASLLSLSLALRDNEWVVPRGVPTSGPRRPLALASQQCKAYFNRMTNWRLCVQRMFRNHRLMELEYETNLVKNPDATLRHVQAFLGVMCQRIAPLTEKQATQKPCEMLTNFRELQQYFRSSPYRCFFDG